MSDRARPDRTDLQRRVAQAFDFAQQQVRGLIERDPDYYPMYTVGGKWRHEGDLWTHWCDGFLPGMMWIFHERTGDESWRREAERYTLPLAARQHDDQVHDLNFVLGSSFGRWHRVTGDAKLAEVLLTAGRTMAKRFKTKGRYLRSFVADESCFIDIMMNVGIIFWAADHAEDSELRRVAEEHCETTRRYLVRGDGSTAHEAIFDLDTGECLRQTTHQGFRGDSCWVRGLAWSLYGFGTAFSHTQNEAWLHTAELNAECFLRHLPDDGVTPYDFFANGSHVPLDTSGSAIAAGGLWQLAELTPSRYRAKRYREAAVRMVDGLCLSHLGDAAAGWEGILRDQIYHIHLSLGVGESCMFGDYFFVEALGKVLDGLERGVI